MKMSIPMSIDLPTIHIFASRFHILTTLKCHCLTLTHLQTDGMFQISSFLGTGYILCLCRILWILYVQLDIY